MMDVVHVQVHLDLDAVVFAGVTPDMPLGTLKGMIEQAGGSILNSWNGVPSGLDYTQTLGDIRSELESVAEPEDHFDGIVHLWASHDPSLPECYDHSDVHDAELMPAVDYATVMQELPDPVRQHRKVRIVVENFVRNCLDVFSCDSETSLGYLRIQIAKDVPVDLIQLSRHGRPMVSGPLRAVMGELSALSLQAMPRVLGGGRFQKGCCSRCSKDAVIYDDVARLCVHCCEDDYVHHRRDEATP